MDLSARTRHLERWSDVGLALAVVLVGIARDGARINPRAGYAPADYAWDLGPAALVAIHVVGGVLLLGRRQAPIAIGIALALVAAISPVVAALVMPYSVARYGGSLRRVIVVCGLLAAGLLTGAGLWGKLGSTVTGDGDPYTPILIVATLTATGLYMRSRSDLLGHLRERAELAEREAQLRYERDRMMDRQAVARTLHDVGAHWVTLMTMQAGALSVSASDPWVSREAEDMRAKGERALAELHRLIAVLASTPDAGITGSSSNQTMAEFVAERSPGLQVHLRERGAASAAPSEVCRVVRSVLTEALLNAVKYAGGGSVEIDLAWGSAAANLRVTSTPALRDPEHTDSPPPGSGLGLESARTSCTDLGGELTATPLSRGRYEVTARIPYRGADRPAPERHTDTERAGERT